MTSGPTPPHNGAAPTIAGTAPNGAHGGIVDLPSPIPNRGLGAPDFMRVGVGGLGDGHNNYAHSMAWFKGRIFLGTTRSNLCMLRLQSSYSDLPLEVWPVECPENMDELYKLDRRAQIWAYDPATDEWEMVFRAPLVEGAEGQLVPREIGYRSMAVFQAASDPEPALYIAAWAPGRAPGGHIMRTTDGVNFERVTRYGILDTPASVTRCLTTLGDKIYFAPTARRGTDGGQQNTAGLPIVFESVDPSTDVWTEVSEPGFGDEGNMGIFTLVAEGNQLYAGTFNLEGLQVWAAECTGTPPYRWRKIIDKGAGRGPLNQAVASMAAFNGSVYVGTGIQGGGTDRVNNVGPAAAEVIRINPDDSWDIISGDARVIDERRIDPLSGLRAGFGNFFNGYVWTMAVHDGWLYAGTYDWSVTMRWAKLDQSPPRARSLFEKLGTETVIENEGGADLWRTRDGENWLPVTRRGFGNAYNFGIRNLVSTPRGMFVGTANVFGPRVAVRDGDGWVYEDNPLGGLEVWMGQDAAQ
ncbi:hypothetical protein [Acuticoccus sediminis]|nr:hypothetical protein [Acuticoccus sediminis]